MMTDTRAACALYTVIALCVPAHPSGAQDRLIQTFSQERGLQPPVWALAQDSVGFLWIGTEGGLYRFDGTEFRRWAPDLIRDAVEGLTVSPAGVVTALERNGRAFDITTSGARPIVLPEPVVPIGLGRVTFDRRGRLWLAREETLWYRTVDGAWHALDISSLTRERSRRIKANPVGGVDVATPTTLWRVEPDETPRALLAANWILDIWYHSADRFVALTANLPDADRLIEVDHGVVRRLLANNSLPAGRPIALAEREGTLWVALDAHLFATRAGEPLDVLGSPEGINSGGPLLVDREGSLWMGSFVGLVHLPEPDTRTWTDRHGLYSRHARMLTKRGDELWIATWGGTNVLDRTRAGWTVSRSPSTSQIHPCVDGRGAVWANAGIPGGVLEIDTASTPRRHARPLAFHGCARARDGGVWMAVAETLLYASPTQRTLRAYEIPAATDRHDALLHDSRNRLWITGGSSICSAPAPLVGQGASAWSCDTIPGAAFAALIELPSGTLWAASVKTGLHALRNGRWLPLNTDSLPTRTVFSLSPSPRGGVWIIGHGFLQRVTETPTGWRVLERLTSWQGLMTIGGGDLIEEDDGTIWIASDRGVTRVPASARIGAWPAPPIVLVDARVDEQRVPLDDVLHLPPNRNRLELRFAALSFRAPSEVRHQVRLGPDEPWSESSSGASFRWVDLRPGRHVVEYRASLDGRTWSPRPMRFAFSVSPPWYRSAWFVGLALGLAAVVAWSIYRARVAYLLGLERQRTRIAMDLHDEVGSGLASVGILSSVLAAEDLPARGQHFTKPVELPIVERTPGVEVLIGGQVPQFVERDELPDAMEAGRGRPHGPRRRDDQRLGLRRPRDRINRAREVGDPLCRTERSESELDACPELTLEEGGRATQQIGESLRGRAVRRREPGWNAAERRRIQAERLNSRERRRLLRSDRGRYHETRADGDGYELRSAGRDGVTHDDLRSGCREQAARPMASRRGGSRVCTAGTLRERPQGRLNTSSTHCNAATCRRGNRAAPRPLNGHEPNGRNPCGTL